MKLAKILTLAAIPALVLSLTACGGKKPAASGSKPAASASAGAGVQLDDKAKAAITAEYKTYDEKNACWVAKGADGDYCMIAKEARNTFRDGVKTSASFVVLNSKGKLVNGALDDSQGGGVGLFLINKADGSVMAKAPFIKAWDKGSVRQSYMLGDAGKELSRLALYDDAQKDDVVEIQNLRIFAQNGNTFTKALDVRTLYADKGHKGGNYRAGANYTTENATEVGAYHTVVLKVPGYFENGKHVDGEKVYKLTYNKAKKAYDVPAEYNKLMGK